ncbi:MAG: caspase family protein, partial [Saprospiraceae bacterium]|nr:caspase family protein [Saprospiraceae bacterium]
EQAQFYYLTKDIASEDLSDPEIRRNFAVSSNDLTSWLANIPAQKQVMILDACNSGKVVSDLASLVKKDLSPAQIVALDRMKDRTGMFILTGSAANKVSFEASQFGQGLLTYSLLQGMSGPALTTDKRVDVMRLFQYSRDEVPVMAKSIGGIQTPILSFPATGASFDIGIVTEQVKIPLAQVKPVFVRNNFQDDATFDDGLGLNRALSNFLQGLTAKGAQSDIVYVDVPEYDNAWSVKGRYTVNGQTVKVVYRLFKGTTIVGKFEKIGAVDNLDGLIESMMEDVWPNVK